VNSHIKKIKDFYDSYKVVIWLFTLFGGGWGYDRIYNFWNIPTRLAQDEIRFIETRKMDSIRFQDHVLYSAALSAEIKNEIKIFKDSLKSTNKSKRK